MTGQIMFTVDEAARHIRISRSGIFQLLKAGEIQSVKIGHLRRIPAQALDAYVARLLAEQSRGAAA